MSKPKVTNSAPLHLKIGAFTALFGALATCFPAAIAFGLAVFAAYSMSKM